MVNLSIGQKTVAVEDRSSCHSSGTAALRQWLAWGRSRQHPGGVAAAQGWRAPGSREEPACPAASDLPTASDCRGTTRAPAPTSVGVFCPHWRNRFLKSSLGDNWISNARTRLPGVPPLWCSLTAAGWSSPCKSFTCRFKVVSASDAHAGFYLQACRPGLKVWVSTCWLLSLLPDGMPSVWHPLY